MFEKKLFKISSVSDSDLAMSVLPMKFIVSLETELSEIKDFYSFLELLIIFLINFFSSNFP